MQTGRRMEGYRGGPDGPDGLDPSVEVRAKCEFKAGHAADCDR